MKSCTFNFRSAALGMNITAEITLEGIYNAFFQSSGNQLPLSMYKRLIGSAGDMDKVYQEIENAISEGDL